MHLFFFSVSKHGADGHMQNLKIGLQDQSYVFFPNISNVPGNL